MVKIEFYRETEHGEKLYKIYSDSNKYIKQIETGIEYSIAIDVADENGNIRYTYEETDKDIEIEVHDELVS